MDSSTVTIDPSIFKAYDVRGIYGQDLTDEIAYRIGQAAAQYLNAAEIAVGRDMRLSLPQLAAVLIRGITDQGANAIELGMTTTDELYFAVGKFNFPVGAMITASHNPGKYNGMKSCSTQAFPVSLESMLDEIRDLALSGNYADEHGNLVDSSMVTVIVSISLLNKHPELTILYNLIVSKSIPELTHKLGGKPVRNHFGHSYIKAEMRKLNGIFGGEYWVHFYFRDNWFTDSGLIAFLITLNQSNTVKPICGGKNHVH